MIQGGTWTEEESTTQSQDGARRAQSKQMNCSSVHPRVRAGERQWSHWLQLSALFLQCFSVCDYHILFLSCTVLLETLANPTQGMQSKAGWDEVLWFQLETFSHSPLATAVGKKELQWQGGFLLKNIFPILFPEILFSTFCVLVWPCL